MKFFTYILHNATIDRFYIGYTSNLDNRIREHNKQKHSTKFTRKQIGSWELKHSEEFDSRTDAIRREKEIKGWKSKVKIKDLIQSVEQSR